jgi:hypothetical protein
MPDCDGFRCSRDFADGVPRDSVPTPAATELAGALSATLAVLADTSASAARTNPVASSLILSAGAKAAHTLARTDRIVEVPHHPAAVLTPVHTGSFAVRTHSVGHISLLAFRLDFLASQR